MTRGRSKLPFPRLGQNGRARGGSSSAHSSRARSGRRVHVRCTAACAAVCVVGLLLLGRVSFAAHMLLVPHLIGADGTLLHETLHGEARARSDALLPWRLAPTASGTDEAEPERCDVVALTEAPPTTSAAPAPARLLVWQRIAAPAPHAVDGAAIPLLMLAPKLSPPW